ncbi:MAG: hypothetical protein LQ345_005838, partial [Seirophora villosa]
SRKADRSTFLAAITVIFARGTGEGGNIGSVIGPPLLKALQSKAPGQVNYQGVPYPATAAVRQSSCLPSSMSLD